MALEEIVRFKRAEVLDKQKNLGELKAQARPTTKSFTKAIKAYERAFICEIKPASPSLGAINLQADVVAIAKTYEPFASVISVLADTQFFGGSLANVEKVSRAVKCPVMLKDIVVDAVQIYEGRAHGADAVLLMLSVLSDAEYRSLFEVARSLNMDVLTEVHSLEEMKRAVALKAPIIGINNRDLKTLKTDLATTDRLLPYVPKDCLVISESGFERHEQVQNLDKRVNGVLVGSSLMKASRIDLKLREIIFGRVKICGITNPEDARLAYDNGAYYGAINFYPGSKRYVVPQEAPDILNAAPLIFGGLFVNSSIAEIVNLVGSLNLNFIQLHGQETPDFVLELRKNLPSDVEIWQAVRVQGEIPNIDKLDVDKAVFDAFSVDGFGGLGKSFDWHLLRGKNFITPYFLAGGINESNALEASRVGAFGLDIASGAEENPRQKSAEKLAKIFGKLRGN